MKALIKVGYGCNENCTFCHTAEMRHLEDSNERIEWKIRRAKALGYTMVVLSGGEPTIRPELLAWARSVAALGLDFGLVTNGLLLSYPHVTDELIERCRLRYVYMSLHGGSARVHKSVVRADTFDKAVGALERLAGRVPDLTVNCVVTTANVEHLRGLVDRLAGFRELTVKFSMTQPKGGGAKLFDVIVPDVERCADRVRDAIEYGLSRREHESLRFAHDGLPFCLLPGLEHLYDDLKTHRFASMIETDEDDYVPVDDVAKTNSEVCAGCGLRGACPGLYRGYAEVHGEAMLRPVTDRPRSNSYGFAPDRDVPRAEGAPCPIARDGVSPYDRGRTLFLRLRDRMRLFRTETRDFSDPELLATKEERGQLYLDVSRKLAPDDFARDLRKLVRAPECETCAERPRCTGCFVPVRQDVFSRDDARLRDLLRGLEGDVLDVGCGEGRYLDCFDAARARYVGVDPDEASLAILRNRRPEFRFVRGAAETLDDALGTFDHVLFLRSVNHLEAPARAFDRAIARLRPGGSLVLVDNVAFGLVRSAEHQQRAEAARENRFEHYRNDGAEETARHLVGRPFRLVERIDVSPHTSNQWLLRYQHVEPSP